MSIKQNGGIFGRNPTFNDVTIDGQLTFEGDIDINSDLKVDGNLVVDGNGEFDSLDVVASGIKANANAAIGFQLGGDASGSTDIGKIVNNAGRFAIEPAGNRKFVVRTNATKVDALEVDHNNNISVPNGEVTSSGNMNAPAFVQTSDYRLKAGVVALTGATDRLTQLKPSRFNWQNNAEVTVDGFLAHEVQGIVPEAVFGTKDGMKTEEYEISPAVEATYDDEGNELTPAVEAIMGEREVPDYQGIDQSKLVPLLVATIQELEARITALESN